MVGFSFWVYDRLSRYPFPSLLPSRSPFHPRPLSLTLFLSLSSRSIFSPSFLFFSCTYVTIGYLSRLAQGDCMRQG